MGKVVKKVTAVLSFIVLLAIVTLVLQEILIRKDEYSRYKEFYKYEEDFDVLFFGSSRVLDCFQPVELWEEYGITSYNLAQHKECVARSYWEMMNALEYTTPKVIVLDVSLFAGDYRLDQSASQEQVAFLHNSLDHMPLSKVKINALKAMCTPRLSLEFLFPMAKYHSRWSDLTKEDFCYSDDYMMGSELRQYISESDGQEWLTEEPAEIFWPETINLDKIVALCRERNIEFLPVCLPLPMGGDQATINSFAAFFAENNIPFLNLWKEDEIMNYKTDFADYSHVNDAGAHKITRAVGQYLADNYSFPEKSPKEKACWDGLAEKNAERKAADLVASKDDLKILLMQLIDREEYRCEIEAPESLTPEDLDLQEVLAELQDHATFTSADREEKTVTVRVYRQEVSEAVLDYEYSVN